MPELPVIERMAASIAQRGPDQWGYYVGPDVALASVRLAIVGVEAGAQPHRGCGGAGVAVVANGEIYNHRELRAGLASHFLDDPCDTAVIPHLYEERGEALVEQLRGMFAFALWDSRESKLVLARDRLGIKPLFLAETPDYLIAASEAKAIFASGLLVPRIDRDALDDLFSMGYPCPPRSMFEGVSALDPGHVLVARPGGPVVSRRYWRAPLVPRGEHIRGSTREIARDLRELLRSAVGDHLMSDIPVAAMVSGGLDSSAVAALAREAQGWSLETFSMSFGDGPEGAPFDETLYSAEVAARLGARSHVVPLSRSSAQVFPEMIWALELPLLMPGALGALILAEAERARGFRVALSGDGADELLGGYDVFRGSKVRRGLESSGLSFLAPELTALVARLSGLPRGIASVVAPRGRQDAIARAWGGVVPPWLGSWRLLDVERERLLSPDGRKVRPILEPPAGFSALVHPDLPGLDPLDAEIAIELETRLPAWILVISDRSSMAHGVEVRVPLLDDRVVDRMLAIPPSMKMRGLREKAILREAVRDLLPPAVLNRRKQPFMTPIGPWFFEERAPDFVQEALSGDAIRDAGLFCPDAVARLRQGFERSPAGHVERFRRELVLMLVLGSQHLARQFVQGIGVPAPRFRLPGRGNRIEFPEAAPR